MITRLSELFLRTLRDDPADAEVPSHKLLVRAGYVRRIAPGVYSWLPLGLRVLREVERVVREEMDAMGAQEILLPALLPREAYETSNRWTEYGPDLFRLKDRRGNDYLLGPTHEEMFTLTVKGEYNSYKDFPVTLYQVQNKYRDEQRPRAGILRGREFLMKDSYSFDLTDEGLEASYQAHRDTYERILTRLGIKYVIVAATSGAMGGSRSEEFMHPSAVGEDTFVRSAGGYAANVEAVTTVVPESLDYADAPDPEVHPTPDSPTIETLVARSNELHPREDAPWTAADTLKNVLLSVSLPEGGTQLVAIGVPGDRDVDLKRVEAGIGQALDVGGELEVAAATEDELRAVPELVKGYIGPGLSLEDPVLGTRSRTGIPYFVDPRVVPGTSWITGANVAGSHVYHLVAERDFSWDATLEACTVREGDPAPDGSGPLEIARGMEMGHVFQLGRKYAESLGLKVLDSNGKLVTVTMGSYGIGVTRALAAVAEFYHDEQGLLWPRDLSPADVHVVATGKGAEVLEAAEEIVGHLEAAGISVIFDDRPKVSPGVKFRDAELLGVPTVLVVGRGLADGLLELKDRRAGRSRDIQREQVVAELTTELHGQDGPAADTL